MHIYRPTGRQHVDLTGKFPTKSVRGYEYAMVFYAEDPNYIHAEPVAGKSAGAILKAFKDAHTFFTERGVPTSYLRLDNEASNELRSYCRKADIKMEFCPPGNHRANKAERCIRTFKNHFIAILCAADPDFPLDQWDLLLPSAEMTLNMLRSSALNPSLSAWEQVQGPYDYAAHPIHPPGIKVVVFHDVEERKTWAPHGMTGYYVGQALDHYRCHRAYLPDTRGVRVTDTVSWHPHGLIEGATDPRSDGCVAAY